MTTAALLILSSVIGSPSVRFTPVLAFRSSIGSVFYWGGRGWFITWVGALKCGFYHKSTTGHSTPLQHVRQKKLTRTHTISPKARKRVRAKWEKSMEFDEQGELHDEWQ